MPLSQTPNTTYMITKTQIKTGDTVSIHESLISQPGYSHLGKGKVLKVNHRAGNYTEIFVKWEGKKEPSYHDTKIVVNS